MDYALINRRYRNFIKVVKAYWVRRKYRSQYTVLENEREVENHLKLSY